MTRRTLPRWWAAFDKPRSFFLRFDVLTLNPPAPAPAERDADRRAAAISLEVNI